MAFKWEILCCDVINDMSEPYLPQFVNEVTVFVYGDNESEAVTAAKELVERGAYQPISCEEDIQEYSYPLGDKASKD